jgi:hypothetical protein
MNLGGFKIVTKGIFKKMKKNEKNGSRAILKSLVVGGNGLSRQTLQV